MSTPKSAKKPADHKPKAEKTDEVKPITVTVREREWEIAPAMADDFELLADLAALESEDNPVLLASVLRRVLDQDQWREAMHVLRDPDTGRVSLEEGAKFTFELFEAIDPNSFSS